MSITNKPLSRSRRNIYPTANWCDKYKTSKIVYRSPAAARKSIDQIRSAEPGKKLYVFECKRGCGGWHISKSVPRT